MPTEGAAARWVEVAAGVILRADGRFLLGQRAPGTFYPGYWEFPGGKVEPGETPAEALRRELREELGIEAREINPWIVREHVYEHARVRLHFFEVADWAGELNDHVHAALAWQSAHAPGVAPMLPANGPILKALRLPRRMGITRAHEVGVDVQLAQLDAALAAGLRLVQVREAGLAPDARRAFAHAAVSRARRYPGALVLLNGDAALAREVGADGVHLTSSELAATVERPGFDWVGASCHTRDELDRAAALGFDYALLGAVKPTPTHPGRAGLGWEGFTLLACGLPLPVLALGGLAGADLGAARAAGAHGIAAIRGAWDQPLRPDSGGVPPPGAGASGTR